MGVSQVSAEKRRFGRSSSEPHGEGMEPIGDILPHVLHRLRLPLPQAAQDEAARRERLAPESRPAAGTVV